MEQQWPAAALTLSLCKELKEFGFYIAKLLLLLWLLQPVPLLPVPPAVLEGGVGASQGLGEQRVPVGVAGGHTTPAPPRLHREGGFAGGSRISAVTCC